MVEARDIFPFDQPRTLKFWISMIVTQLTEEEYDVVTLHARRLRIMRIYNRLQPLENAHKIKTKGLWFGIHYCLFDESSEVVRLGMLKQMEERPKYIELFTGTRAERVAKCVAKLMRKYDKLVNKGHVNPEQLL